MLHAVVWGDEYKVGETLIDNQHEAMFNAYNNIAALVRLKRDLTMYDVSNLSLTVRSILRC